MLAAQPPSPPETASQAQQAEQQPQELLVDWPALLVAACLSPDMLDALPAAAAAALLQRMEALVAAAPASIAHLPVAREARLDRMAVHSQAVTGAWAQTPVAKLATAKCCILQSGGQVAWFTLWNMASENRPDKTPRQVRCRTFPGQ